MPKGSNQKNKLTIEYIRDKLKELNPNIKLVSTEYINNRTPLKLICECGREFEKRWDNIQRSGYCCCRNCSSKYGWKENRRNITYEEYLIKLRNEFYKNGFEIIQKDLNNITNQTKLLCMDKDGYIGKINYTNVILNKHFSVFSKRFNFDNLLFNLNVFSKNTGSGVKVIKILDTNTRTCEIKILCKCNCGNEYETSVGDFTSQKRIYCKECTKRQSTFEKLVKIELLNYTKEENIIEQKRFKDCINEKTKYPLPFDFYLVNENICIEVDGQQHFKPTNIRGHVKYAFNYCKTR